MRTFTKKEAIFIQVAYGENPGDSSAKLLKFMWEKGIQPLGGLLTMLTSRNVAGFFTPDDAKVIIERLKDNGVDEKKESGS